MSKKKDIIKSEVDTRVKAYIVANPSFSPSDLGKKIRDMTKEVKVELKQATAEAKAARLLEKANAGPKIKNRVKYGKDPLTGRSLRGKGTTLDSFAIEIEYSRAILDLSKELSSPEKEVSKASLYREGVVLVLQKYGKPLPEINQNPDNGVEAPSVVVHTLL